MDKLQKAKLILIETNSLETCDDWKRAMALVQEIVKDARDLAEQIIEEEAA